MLKEGDQVLAQILYARHTSPLMGFVLHHVNWDRNDAEDLVQDTWMRAFRGLRKFRWESSFQAWLCAIALNRIREIARRRKGPPDWPVFGEPAVSRPADILLKVDLERAMENVPNRARSVFVLHDIEGCTHSEVSKALSITAGTSKSQLHRARSKIRRALSGEMS